MEFHIRLGALQPDIDAVERSLLAEDPSALVDISRAGDLLRIATSLSAIQLATLLDDAGWPVPAQQIEQLPSICCGGCSG